MKIERGHIIRFVPAVLIAIGIAVASLWEYPQVPKTVALHDKIVHGLMYAILAFSVMAAFLSIHCARIKQYIFTCVGVTFYGALMEVLQHYCTLSRSGDIDDLYADFFGALLGLLLVAIIQMAKCQMTNHQ